MSSEHDSVLVTDALLAVQRNREFLARHLDLSEWTEAELDRTVLVTRLYEVTTLLQRCDKARGLAELRLARHHAVLD